MLKPVPKSNRPPSFHILVVVGLTICHVADLSRELSRGWKSLLHGPTATSGPFGASSGLALRGRCPITCTGTSLLSPVKHPCCCTFCHFVISNLAQAPLLSVDRQHHPALTTAAFPGCSSISSSANLEGTTVGPTACRVSWRV